SGSRTRHNPFWPRPNGDAAIPSAKRRTSLPLPALTPSAGQPTPPTTPRRWHASARTRAGESVPRRTQMPEPKIAQAEQQAIADVRAAAADAAVAAAERILRDSGKGNVADALL